MKYVSREIWQIFLIRSCYQFQILILFIIKVCKSRIPVAVLSLQFASRCIFFRLLLDFLYPGDLSGSQADHADLPEETQTHYRLVGLLLSKHWSVSLPVVNLMIHCSEAHGSQRLFIEQQRGKFTSEDFPSLKFESTCLCIHSRSHSWRLWLGLDSQFHLLPHVAFSYLQRSG